MGRPRSNFTPLPPLVRLDELFNYDPDTGDLTRKTTILGGGPAGTQVGTIGRGENPRRWVQIDGNTYDAARVCYALVNRTLPDPKADLVHLDSIRLHNWASNLALRETPKPEPTPEPVEEEAWW